MAYFLNVPATSENFTFFNRQLKCQRCGMCCKTKAGQILKPNEVDLLAEKLKLSKHQFKEKYTFTKDGERFINSPCPFLNGGCSIYSFRPQVCRQFPFNKVYHHPTKGDYMTVADCPAGRIINDRFGVKV